MKTVNFASFANDKIQENDLNYLKGGFVSKNDPVDDLLTPPQR